MPGIPSVPGPGQFYASPALSALLASTPADRLADRYPGRQIGTIGDAALPSPDALTIVIGRTPDQISHLEGAKQVTAVATTASAIPVAGLDLILSVVAGGLLFPVLIFIGTATRLMAAGREQRFAAMRLIGATPGQISVISAVEATAAAVAGTAAGFGLFFLFRDPIAAIPFTGLPFYPSDLSLGMLEVVLVAIGVPAAAAVAAGIALRRVRISPLGVARRVTPRRPRAYRLIPALVGIGALIVFIGRVPETSNGQVAAFLPAILLIMVGLLLAGPWLTMLGAQFLARHAGRPATLIAARRLGDDPHAAFRAISGVVLALFVTSVAVGVIATIVANRGADRGGVAATSLIRSFGEEAPSVPDAVTAGLRSSPGVQSVMIVRANPANGPDDPPGVVSCADLARTPAYGRCPDGSAFAQFFYRARDQGPETVWPAAGLTPAQFQRLPVRGIVVATDGSAPAIERARTILENTYPNSWAPPATDDDFNSIFTSQLAGFQRLADVVILASLPIAGCSLAVSVAAGLSDRKRPFSLLRLSGTPLRTLRRVVALESAVPLLVVSVVAIGIGLFAAQLFLRAQMHYTLRPPGIGYYAVVIAGLAISLGIIAATLPLLERITGPETARND
ncbi:MAG TPA: ABC transporter permease [Micromonosporaceae bacterium]